MNDRDLFLEKSHPNFRDIIEKVMSGVESADKMLQGKIMWGKYTYALDGDFHYWICAVATTKKAVNLIFHFGGLLSDRQNVFISGSSVFFRKIEYLTIDGVDKKMISNFVGQALSKLDYFKKNWREISKTGLKK